MASRRARYEVRRSVPPNSDSDDEIFLPPMAVGNPSHSPGDHDPGPRGGQEENNLGLWASQHGETRPNSAITTSTTCGGTREAREARSSIIDGLLFEIYDRLHFGQHRDSYSDTCTEYSSTSEVFGIRSDCVQTDFSGTTRLTRASLETKGLEELRKMVSEMRYRSAQASARLVRQLKRRDRRLAKQHKQCDIITAIIQASSLKRRIDTRMKFTLDPLPGDDAFQQWHDAMKAVARLPLGIPGDFRKRVWLTLADAYVASQKIDWEQTIKFTFNEKSNPDDNNLGMQIVKDLHRTGCSGFSGQDNEQDRAVLKRVLLAYARWNKLVGYCQGFNVLAALVLDVVDRKEEDALKVMVFLIDHVLPASYFANNLRALSVDMAVFRDLLRMKLPDLSQHLDYLQAAARDATTGANYEPPLTNVFTMQWFLTLFATCLPKSVALRIWDSVLLEGSEILLRTALAIWGKLAPRIMSVQSADEFYTTMGVLTQEMLDSQIVQDDELIKIVYTMAPFPFPMLSDLREKYTYNITPFTAAMNTGTRSKKKSGGITSIFSDEDELDEEDFESMRTCFAGFFPTQASPVKQKNRSADDGDQQSAVVNDISNVSPGAFAASPLQITPSKSAYMERMNMDINALQRQYSRLKQRQKQAHVILQGAVASAQAQTNGKPPPPEKTKEVMVPRIESPVAMNHLFVGRKNVQGNKNRYVTEGPRILPVHPGSNMMKSALRVRAHSNAHKSRSDSVSSQVSGRSNESEVTVKDEDSVSDLSGPVSPSSERSLVDSVVSIESSSRGSGDHTPQQDTESGSLTNNVDGRGDEENGDKELTSESNSQDNFGAELQEQLESLELSKGEEERNSEVGEDIGIDGSGDASHPSPKPNLLAFDRPHLRKDSSASDVSMGSSNSSMADCEPQDPDEKTAQYITKITYKNHKQKQQDTTGSLSQVASATITQNGVVKPAAPSPAAAAAAGISKKFNPFPVASRHISHKRTKNGIKLGLYSSEQLAAQEPIRELSSKPPLSTITRAQINACLHRQYMAELKQQRSTSNNR